MEEFRIDCLHQTEEELGVAKELRQNIFRLNHTMPDTEEYRELLHKVFPHLGENCRIETPFSGVRTANVKFGRNVIVMHNVEPNTLSQAIPPNFIRKINHDWMKQKMIICVSIFIVLVLTVIIVLNLRSFGSHV